MGTLIPPPQFISTIFPISNCCLYITFFVPRYKHCTTFIKCCGKSLSVITYWTNEEYQMPWWFITVILSIKHEVDLCMKMYNQG